MASIESIEEKLRVAAEELQKVLREIQDLPLEPTGIHIQGVSEALANISPDPFRNL